LFVFIGVWIGDGAAVAETASCSALIKQRDAECQTMAEKMEAVCSAEKAETRGEQSSDCRKLGEQLAAHCNRNPCKAAPKKGKKTKAKKTTKKTDKTGMAAPK
jgi:hypothetical protein